MTTPTDPPPCPPTGLPIVDGSNLPADLDGLDAAEAHLIEAVLGDSPHPPSVRLRLLRSGLAEVVDIDGVPTLVVDPIFDLARAAALAGLEDRDAAEAPPIVT